ncbi:MAG: hypothetical protein JNL83_32120 [Myxococcales bacterium]|nr:hypothetical protein [Myxococcales bacterium]
MRASNSVSAVLSTIVIAVLALVTTASAERKIVKDKPNPAFAGKIMLSEKRFPTQAPSLAAFNAKIRAQSKTDFREDKATGTWKIQVAGFLKAPLNDVEYVVKIYEVGKGPQQLLATVEQYTDTRGQTSLITSIMLEKKTIGVNKNLLMTMENRGRVLASGRLRILGEGERYNGKVNFSEEEAQGGAKEEE